MDTTYYVTYLLCATMLVGDDDDDAERTDGRMDRMDGNIGMN